MKSIFITHSFLLFTIILCNLVTNSIGNNVKKSVDDNRDDNGETNDETKEDSLDVPIENEPGNTTCFRRENIKMHEIRVASSKQFPFMASIMSNQYEHLCSGAVVSNGMILTTAQCTQAAIGYVLLGSITAKKDDTSAALRIKKFEQFPTFIGTESDKDIGIVYTEKYNRSVAVKIKLSNYTSVSAISDFEAIGFGLNVDVGQTKELQFVGLEHRNLPSNPIDVKDSISGYIDCINTKVLTCFKDFGGPAIFDDELVGIITRGEDKCITEMTSSYVINKKMIDAIPTYKFKSWLDERIKKNEEVDEVALAIFPMKPVSAVLATGTSSASGAKRNVDIPRLNYFICLFICVLIFLI